MAPYYPLTVCRSDGQFAVMIKAGVLEPNQPTPAQTDDTPDINGNVDCYKKLEPEETKAVDWRRKLGGMLMHLLGGKGHAGSTSYLNIIIVVVTNALQIGTIF